MRNNIILSILLTLCCTVSAQSVDQATMKRIYEASRTPYKYGMVVAPQTNNRKIDCPSVFREGNTWFMTYVCYNGASGTDGRGYETWIAKSDDLLHWTTLGRVLAFGDKGWDMNQRGGFPALIDYEWGGSYQLQTFRGRHWMTYIGGEGTGYEAVNAPLSIGLASTKGDITKAHQWETYQKPILTYNEKDAQWWEQMTQYKSTIYKDDKKTFGYPFIMFYNAGGKDATHPKGERIGIALSKDMFHWKRYKGNPIFAHDTDGTITGDAQIVKMGDVYVMYYFSAFNPTREYKAFNTFAASRDLVNWTDWTGADLIIPSKPYDEMFAHKSCVINYGGTVYHFYCAVNNAGQRGIALATSKPKGKSEVNFPTPDPTGKRHFTTLNDNWTVSFDGKQMTTDIPYNLDDYHGALQKIHGNLHGEATFSKSFVAPDLKDKQYFIKFEGIGTYAEITLNGVNLGKHDVGRTVLTLDVTKQIRIGATNSLVVKVSHPSNITDMPWVCGGCSSEWGFSEGSQPFGIYRPVTLEITDPVRVEPFGVQVWNNMATDSVFVNTDVHNYSNAPVTFSITSKLCSADGKQVSRLTEEVTLAAGEMRTIHQSTKIENPNLWSPEKPYLYTMNTIIKRNGKATDDLVTPFGIRTMTWPLTRKDGDNTFKVNGKSVFINGTCEYEHEFGQSHAFSDEQIMSRINAIKNAGFNAFRDAHQPHNLKYNSLLDKYGMLWWPQFSAHIWFDTPQFRESFKRHLIQWVKERRNSPSIMLWGLQNESVLPADFAKECTDLIRKLDPTCGTMRLVTTCNGGEGTDWNVVQNWSGTYGGNINKYGEELKRDDQLLNGEYGAWRTMGNHSGKGYSEEKFCDLMQRKMQLADSVHNEVCGQFQWIFTSHDNPGRRQPDEALRRIDKVGPFNYKGLMTAWEQPNDGYYMYKSHYVSASKEPMVYVVPNVCADSLRVYSNCDSVTVTCGTWSKTIVKPRNTSLFKWYNLGLRGDILTASAWYEGRIVATDSLALDTYNNDERNIITASNGYNYMYRLNCGGDEYTDCFGNKWMQDNSHWSHSWGDKFKGISSYQTSQTENKYMLTSSLFRTSRFGRHELSYSFPAPKGDYRVELYFIEPWYGIGSSETTDWEGTRLFDVAVNGNTCIKNLDLWAQKGYGKPYKRVIDVHNDGNAINICFPKVNAGQAIISAIAIATKDSNAKPAAYTSTESKNMWAAFNKDILINTPDSILPPRADNSLKATGKLVKGKMTWTFNVGVAKIYALRWKYYNPECARDLHVKITDGKGTVYKDDDITFVKTQEKKTKRRMTSITTGSQINAGKYTVVVSGKGIDKMLFDELTIE